MVWMRGAGKASGKSMVTYDFTKTSQYGSCDAGEGQDDRRFRWNALGTPMS
jgi:hypothetical protein